MKYEVIAGIYQQGADESLEEEVIFETDDLTEAQEMLAELSEEEEEEVETEDEVPE